MWGAPILIPKNKSPTQESVPVGKGAQEKVPLTSSVPEIFRQNRGRLEWIFCSRGAWDQFALFYFFMVKCDLTHCCFDDTSVPSEKVLVLPSDPDVNCCRSVSGSTCTRYDSDVVVVTVVDVVAWCGYFAYVVALCGTSHAA